MKALPLQWRLSGREKLNNLIGLKLPMNEQRKIADAAWNAIKARQHERTPSGESTWREWWILKFAGVKRSKSDADNSSDKL